jgi:hypothetical protein
VLLPVKLFRQNLYSNISIPCTYFKSTLSYQFRDIVTLAWVISALYINWLSRISDAEVPTTSRGPSAGPNLFLLYLYITFSLLDNF